MSTFPNLIAESQRRFTDGDDALEAAINLPAHQVHSDAIARALADELARAYSVDATKTREINLLTKENRDQADALASLTRELEGRPTIEEWSNEIDRVRDHWKGKVAAVEVERDLLTERLQQIADLAPPTLPRYENALNIIRDIQHVARATVEAFARGRDLSRAQPGQEE